MPSIRKRIGYLPSINAQKTISKIANKEKLSQSKVVGILVEEALMARVGLDLQNSNDLIEAINIIPNDRLLVETDSPYLAPMPFRGKSNEPSYIIHTLEKLSEIKKISKQNLSKITSDNFLKIFNIN